MTLDELLQAAKLRVRKKSKDSLDDDIKQLANAAKADLSRLGVHSSYLEEPDDPLIVEAILTYVRAKFSMDDNYDRHMASYKMLQADIKTSGKYKQEKADS
ncbi:MAG: hypothetical protein IJZ96_08540 [Lachnospiraceae bacterium]|nr:hypothetical protein [Lachnospiraceae bacterium]